MFDQYSVSDYPVFLGGEVDHDEADNCFFQIVPVPWEETDPYGAGTAKGPASILNASSFVDEWDGKSNPSQMGIHTYPPLDVQGEPERTIDNIASITRTILRKGKFPVVLGGEHAVTFGVVKGYIEAGVEDFGVVQIDAHACLREMSEGCYHSHLSVMKRVVEKNIPLMQLGVRTCSEDEMRTREVYGVHFHDADELVLQNMTSITIPPDFPDRVFLTLDIDGIDPSFFPSTSIPEPGGLSWYQTLHLIESVAKQREIIGFDLCQFSPIKGFHAYQHSAAKLVYKIMGIVERSKL